MVVILERKTATNITRPIYLSGPSVCHSIVSSAGRAVSIVLAIHRRHVREVVLPTVVAYSTAFTLDDHRVFVPNELFSNGDRGDDILRKHR